MKLTFLATVKAINPTDTSNFVNGVQSVSLYARRDDEHQRSATIEVPLFTHEETRVLGTLYGQAWAVRVTFEAGDPVVLHHESAVDEVRVDGQPRRVEPGLVLWLVVLAVRKKKTKDSGASNSEANTETKPSNCSCEYPRVKVRNGSGHHNECPAGS